MTTREFDQQVISYASALPPEIWHKMAMDWNWDNSSIFLHWLISNPQTDRGTALMLYWMANPKFSKIYTDRSDVLTRAAWYLQDYDFISVLEERYMSNFYSNHGIAYNPGNCHTGTDWTAENPEMEIVKEIPPVMYYALLGKEIDLNSAFIEGIPKHLYDQL